MTLISALQSATNALRGDQLALNATADNISNQNTAGYAKRQATWTSQDSVSIGANTGIEAPVVTISAQRDAGLDRSVQSAQSNASSASSQKSALTSLESLFTLDSSGEESSGVSTALSGFFTAASTLASDPTGSSTRQSMYTASQQVVQAFNQASTLLTQQSTSLDSSVSDNVASVNQATKAIAALNQQIQAQPAGTNRDALVDTRNAQVDALSKLVGLAQTTDTDGTVDLSTTNGAPLVVGSSSVALSTSVVSGKLRILSSGTDVTSGITGGSIGGALTVRDGTLQSTRDSLDALASSFATAVNTTNAAGDLADGTAGSAIFSLPSTTSGAAGQIALVATDGSSFAAASTTEGSSGNSNANALAALQNTKNSSGDTFAEVMGGIVTSIGNAASASSTAATTTAGLLTAASTQQDTVSGISLDTEAANLTQYQRSYQAEAKLIAILNEVMATSINLGTDTAVS